MDCCQFNGLDWDWWLVGSKLTVSTLMRYHVTGLAHHYTHSYTLISQTTVSIADNFGLVSREQEGDFSFAK